MIYDQAELLPGCDWTEEHTAQGFARRESTVCFGTLMESGFAEVAVSVGDFCPNESYERVICVPFYCASGKVTVEGPEETDVDRTFNLPVGNYRLTSAQVIVCEDEERIDLFFEPVSAPLNQSSILVADKILAPFTPLIETSEIAGA